MKTHTDNRPDFRLMTSADIISFYHLQMPRWLFGDSSYADMALESKVAYTFLLNRFQLSRRNGWVNEHGEVYVIFTREELAREMQTGYKKAIACFKELADRRLIWECRPGRGKPNRIFMADVTISPSAARTYDCAPFSPTLRSAETEYLAASDEQAADTVITAETDAEEEIRPAESAHQPAQGLPERQILTSRNDRSASAETACPDLPNPPTSKKYFKNTDLNDTDRENATVPRARSDADAESLAALEAQCCLSRYKLEEQTVLRDAIAWLFFCGQLRAGPCTYPQSYVRQTLARLSPDTLDYALEKIRANERDGLRNTLAYAAKIVFCAIAELDSDMLLDPVINRVERSLEASCT